MTLPFAGSISSVPPANELGRSLARSSTKYGLEPAGKVNLSRPARRVAVASILILLSSVCAKYPGEASEEYVGTGLTCGETWEHTVRVEFSEPLAGSKGSRTCVKAIGTEKGHDLEVSVCSLKVFEVCRGIRVWAQKLTERGSSPAVVEGAQTTDLLIRIGDIS